MTDRTGVSIRPTICLCLCGERWRGTTATAMARECDASRRTMPPSSYASGPRVRPAARHGGPPATYLTANVMKPVTMVMKNVM